VLLVVLQVWRVTPTLQRSAGPPVGVWPLACCTACGHWPRGGWHLLGNAVRLWVLCSCVSYDWVPYGFGCHTAVGAIRLWVPYGFGCHTALGAIRLWVPYGSGCHTALRRK